MMIEPSVEQAEQCAIVQQEVVELVNRLSAEGFDRRIIMAGMAAATAASVMSFYGPSEISKWFARQAVMTMHFDKLSS